MDLSSSGKPALPEEIGFPRVYTGRQLARISRPLGGIGTAAPSGWGFFELSPQKLELATAAGAIFLSELIIVPFRHLSQGRLKVTSAGREIEHKVSSPNGGILLQPSAILEVDSTKPLLVHA